jgi:polysaccharide transporter, PST family
MSIVRAGALSAVAAAARLVSGLVVIKLVAWFGGPEGVAKLGQYMSLMSLVSVLAGGSIGAGIIKYVAEHRGNAKELRNLLGTGTFYVMCASALVGTLTFISSGLLTHWLLGDGHYRVVIWILALAQPAIAAGNYLIAVINGLMEVRRLLVVHVVGAAITIVATAALTYYLELNGALLALVLGQVTLLVVSLPLLRRIADFDWSFLRPRFNRLTMMRLTRFSLMTLTSAVLSPLVNIIVRNDLASRFSWEQVGYWQAVSKVSEAYLLFITMAISVYHLPKLSATTQREAFKSELRSAFRYIIPAVMVLALAVYVLRGVLTRVLFSADFAPADSLYAPQLVGDVIKIASFILSYVMLAKAMTTAFIASELVFSASYVGLVYVLTGQFGLVGAMYAFAVNYTLYFGFTAAVALRHLHGMQR